MTAIEGLLVFAAGGAILVMVVLAVVAGVMWLERRDQA